MCLTEPVPRHVSDLQKVTVLVLLTAEPSVCSAMAWGSAPRDRRVCRSSVPWCGRARCGQSTVLNGTCPPADGTVVTSQHEDRQSHETCAAVLGNSCLHCHMTGEELLAFLSLLHQHLLERVGFRPALAYRHSSAGGAGPPTFSGSVSWD